MYLSSIVVETNPFAIIRANVVDDHMCPFCRYRLRSDEDSVSQEYTESESTNDERLYRSGTVNSKLFVGKVLL